MTDRYVHNPYRYISDIDDSWPRSISNKCDENIDTFLICGMKWSMLASL